MRKTHIIITLFMLLFSFVPSAFADQLADAKRAGVIGEGNNGYLAPVKPNPSPEVMQLITSVNAARKIEYNKIASKNGQYLTVVEKLAAGKLIERTESGNFVQNEGGEWIRK